MKNANQAPGLLRSRSSSFAFMLLTYCVLLLMPGWARGQTKEYATVTPSSGRNGATFVAGLFGSYSSTSNNNVAQVSAAANAGDGNEDTFTTLTASNLNLLGLVQWSGEAWIQPKFAKTMDAGVTSFVRINNVRTQGISVDLLDVVGGLLGLLEKNVIIPEVYSDADASSIGTKIADGNVSSTIVKDGNNNIYLAITSSESYNSVRVKLRNQGSLLGLSLGSDFILDVHEAFVLEDRSCASALFTDLGKTTSISISLGDIIQNPQSAVDNDPNTYSTITTGTLNLLGSVFQTFYFNGLSAEQDYFKIKFKIGGGSALDLNVLGNFEVRAYNGNQLVYTKKLQGALVNGLDLLTLLKSGNSITVPFGPGVPFDRVAIGINTTLAVNLASSPLQVYSVERYGLGNSPLTCVDPEPPIADEGDNHMLGLNRECANILVGHQYANFPFNAVDGDPGTYTVLEATSGSLLGSGAYNGNIRLGYTNQIPANTTSYVKIDVNENGLLSGLLDGGLGESLTSVTDRLLFGKLYFRAEVYSENTSSTPILSGTSEDAFYGKPIRIVQDKYGDYYVAITPDQAYQSIKLTLSYPSLIGAEASRTMKVYGMCYSTGSEPCEQGFATFSESSGITLDLLGLGAAGVTDAQSAIDDDINTAAKVSVGAVGVAGSMMQHVQFHGLSSDRDHFRVKMKMNSSGVVNADVIGSIIVKAYNGEQEVYSQRLNEQLIPGVDLLNLLSTGQMINIPFAPGKAFDRVAVGIASLVGADVISVPLEIFSVQRFSADCPDPELQWDPKTKPPFNTPACVGEVNSFENVNFPYEAITDNPNADTYATLTAGAGVAAGLGSYSSHIELKYSGVGAAAHEVSYIRVDTEGNLFKALLGGSLGNALGNVLGSVALGNQYIVVQTKDAVGNPVGTAHSSVAGFNNEFVKLVKDKDGKYYLAVTAADAYQSVRIEYHHTALVGVMGSSALKVYSMCRETEFDACEQATFTSWDGTGIALDIADLTKGGVANPEFAIDGNNSNYSTLNVGVAGVGASVSQKLYFKTKSDITDELRVRLQLANPGILNLDLFGNTKLIFYDGEQNVKEMTLASGLINNIDLLGLFNSGGVQSFTFAPGVAYNRVELRIETVVGVNTSAPIRLYGMSRITAGCPDPDFLSPNEVFKSPVCAEGIELNNVKAVDDVANAVDGDYNTYANMRSDAGAIFGIGNKESILELKYGTTVDPNTTSYLRIGDDAGILESMLSGSIGEAVYGLLNNVALGDNYFVVRAKNGANTVLEASSRNGFAGANGKMKVVQDKAGRYYVAISPDEAYTSIEIKAFSESLLGLLANGYNLHVYGMCHETDFSGCQEGFSTSWDGSGLSVGITGVGSYGVTDAFKALNNNNNGDFSTLSLGTLNVAGHIQQNIRYTKSLPANTAFRLKMEVGTGAVNAAVFDDIRIIGYKDGVESYNEPLQTAVLGGVSLGTLFNNGGAHDVNFVVNQEVDEIALRLNSLVNATVAVPDVRLYYIVQECNVPVFSAWKSFEIDGNATKTSVSGGEEVEYTIHVRNTGSVDVNDYIITDAIPANTTYVAGSGGTFANGAVTFTGIDVAAGATATVSFKVTVNLDLTGVTKISNVALVKKDVTDLGTETFPPSPTDPNEPKTNGDKGTDIPVIPVSTIVTWKAALAKSAGTTVTSVSGGETIDYTIYIKNTGNQALTGVQVIEALPAGTILASGSSLTFAPFDIAVGATESVIFQVIVKDDLTGITSISNLATVTAGGTPVPTTPADPTNPTFGPDATKNPGDPTLVPVTDNFALVSWKNAVVNNDPAVTTVKGGEVIEYTIYVRNTGNKDLNNVEINDPLPVGTTLVSGALPFNIATLKVGATSTGYKLKVKVNENLTGISEIRNIAKVTSTEITTEQESYPPATGGSNEPATNEPVGTATPVTPVNSIDLTLTGASNGTNSGMAAAGDVLTYLVTITNTGNKDLTNVLLVDAIPSNTTLLSAGDFTLNGTNLERTIPTLAAGATENYTFTVTVDNPLGGSVNSIDNSVTASSTEVTKTVPYSMPTTCTAVTAADLQLSGPTGPVCISQPITLTALRSDVTGLTDDMIKWYSAYNSTTGVVSGYLGQGVTISVTPTTLGATKYYAVVDGAGFCFDNPPAEIPITVNALPATPTITPSSATVCESEQVTLTATGGLTYIWSKVGEVAPLVETGAVLTLTNVSSSDAGFYTVKAVNITGCASGESAAVEVVVTNKPTKPVLSLSVTGPVCEGEVVTLTSNATGTHQWFRDGQPIAGAGSANTYSTDEEGVYTVTVTGIGGCVSALSDPVSLEFNPTPVITIIGSTNYTLPIGGTITLNATTSNGTLSWYDPDGNSVSAGTVSFPEAGIYTYTAVAVDGSCVASESIIVTVFDASDCPPAINRIFATSTERFIAGIGGVADLNNAIDPDPTTYSTITVAVPLLGTGAGQALYFNEVQPKGTPVSIKIAKEYSGAVVAGGISVVGLDGSGNMIGAIRMVDGDIANLLGGDNVLEYTFVPSDNSGPQEYKGVRVYVSALLGVAMNYRVYNAYTHSNSNIVDCDPVSTGLNPNILDLYHGVRGVNVASGTSTVFNAWNAVDGDMSSYASVSRTLTVLNQAFLTPVFKGRTTATDSLCIVLSQDGASVLELGLLNGFSIQRYLGKQQVGSPIDYNNSLLDLKLLDVNQARKSLYLKPSDGLSFDRVELSWGGVLNVNLGETIKVYDVSIIPTIDFGINPGDVLEVCQGGNITITKQDDCTLYEVYDESDQLLFSTDKLNFTVPTSTTVGLHKYYVQAIRYGCTIGPKQEVTVQVNALPTPSSIKLNGGEQTTITLAPYEELNVEVTTDANTTIAKWEINESGTWNEYTVSGTDKTAFTYAVPLKPAGSQVKFRALLTSDKACDAYTSEIVLNIKAQEVDYDKSKLVVIKGTATADGTDQNTVEAQIRDKFDMSIAGITVDFIYGNLVTGIDNTSAVVTDVTGNAVLNITSTKIGQVTIDATVAGTAITNSPATVTFVAGAIDFRKSNIEVVRTGAVADGIQKNTVRVNLFDKFDNPVADSTVVYTVTGLAGVQTTSLTGTSDASGQFTLDLWSEKIGTASITATANGTAITLGSPALVTFVAGAIDFRKSNIEVVRTGAVADGIQKNTVRVNLFDKFDNPVADSTVVYTVTGLAGVQTTSLTGTSDASGQFPLDLMSEKIGTASITAMANGTVITVGSPATVTFVAGAIDFRKSNIEVVRTGAVADGIQKNTVRVNLFDKFDNPVADSTVVYTVTGLAGVQTTSLTGTSDASGQFTLDLWSEKIGTASITATANGNAITVGSPALVTFVAGAVDYGKSNLKVTKDGAIADGVDYNEFTATIVDKFENPIANKDVVFGITNPDGSKTSKTITTDANGKAVIPTTSTKPGIVTVDAQVDAKSINGSPATARFVIANNLEVTKVADQNRVKAGTNTTFTVTIKNNGPADIAAGKVITLGELPSAGLTITGYEVTSANGTATGTGNSATVTTNSVIAVGGTITVKVTAAVGADAPSTITNGIKVWGPDKDPGTDPEDDKDDTPPIPVDRESNLSIVKKSDQTRVKAGENTTFTLTITNDGPSTIDIGKKIQLTERPGAGVTIDKYEIISTNATVNGTANNATVTTTAKIAQGQTIVVKVTAKVDADAPTTITNGITVWGPDKDPGTDPEDDKDDTPPIPVDRDYNLTIEKIADEARVKAGETTTFTVTITNNGPSVMEIGKDIKLTERPSAGVTIEKYEIIGNNATISGSGNKTTVTTTAKLALSGTITVKITAKIDDEAPENITNGISVWRPGKPDTEDPDDKDDTPEIPVIYPLIQAVDDIAETKTAIPVTVDVLANDIVTKWDIVPASIEVVASSAGAQLNVEMDGKVTYTSSRDMIGEDTFTYRVKDVKGRWSNTATVRVAVASNDLDIPNIITPNGDGKNDVFRIKGIELYDKVSLTIVNRWGNEVYKSNTYNNDWGGLGLSEGTYFYVLELLKGGKVEVQKGWVTIKSN